MTGSRAQPHGAVDAFSDYDLEMFTTDPGRYASSAGWMTEIGDVWVYLPEESSGGSPTRLVIFEGGEKVDFSIEPVTALEQAVNSREGNELFEQGYVVLVDKHGLASRLPPPSYSSPAPHLPAEAEFRAAVEEFWFEAWHIPKYLRRGDLWVVKFRDWTMKELLLRMMEWNAVATKSGSTDIGHIGARMKAWAPPDVWQRLHEVFGRFDKADSRRALLAMTSLFRDVAMETAGRLGYQYPQAVDEAISGYIQGFDSPKPETGLKSG